jgi:hypothetical protein
MLHAWGFDRVGVVASDMYFVDPNPTPGQEGPEHGVRVEVRLFEHPPVTGSVYAAQPIVIERLVWRADLFESLEGEVGSSDRTHHHPNARGWEPGKRAFDEAMMADPVTWLTKRLSDLPALLESAQIGVDEVGPDDARRMAAAAGEIAAKVEELLAGVRRGELGLAPAGGPTTDGARAGSL